MRRLWKNAGIVAAAAVATGLLAALGSVTHGDVARYHGWAGPAHLRAPQLGQFYIITDSGVIRDPLCELSDSDLTPRVAQYGRRYVNWLGKATPLVFDVVAVFVPPLGAADRVATSPSVSHVLELRGIESHHAPAVTLNSLTREILVPRDLDRIEKHGSTEAYREAVRFSACAEEITASLASGFNVCQVNEVIREAESGALLGVGFASRCLARQETDSGPRQRPALAAGSFLSDLKLSLDLLEDEPVAF